MGKVRHRSEDRHMKTYALVLSALLAQAAAFPVVAQGLPAGKMVITDAAMLPKRTVTIQRLPSEYLDAPRDSLQPLVLAYESNLRNDLESLDIQDRGALRNIYSQLSSLAQFRGDVEEVRRMSSLMRPLAQGPGSTATIGVLPGILTEQKRDKRDAKWVRSEVEKRFADLPWNDAGAVIKNMKAQIERFDPEEVRRTFRQRLDVMAKEQEMIVPETMISAIASSRAQIDMVAPVKSSIVAGLQAVIDRNTPKTAASAPVAK